MAIRNGHSGAAVRALQLIAQAGDPVDNETYEAVLRCCMDGGQWRAGLRAFNLCLQAARREGSRATSGLNTQPHPRMWRTVIRGLLKAGQADAAGAVAIAALSSPNNGHSSNNARPLVDERLLCSLLDLCASKGRMRLAEQLVERMESSGLAMGPVGYCILVKGYGRQRRVHMVDATLSAMRRGGVRPDVVAMNAAMDAYVRCGDLRKAKAVLLAMEGTRELQPNTRSYNTLVKGLGRQGRLEEAFALLAEMRRRGCEPNQVTSNTLIDACVRCGQLERAAFLLRTSDASIEAFTSVLSGFGEAGDKAAAIALFQRMVAVGVRPNLVTYTALITACVNCGDLRDARRIFSALERRAAVDPQLAPSVVTYNSLITGFCRIKAPASSYGNDTASATPDATAAAAAAAAAAEAAAAAVNDDGEANEALPEAEAPVAHEGVQEALQLLLSMRRKGVAPNEVTVNAILDGLVSLSPPRMGEAESLLSLARSWGIVPSAVTYSTLVKGYGRAGDVEAANATFDGMLRDGRIFADVAAANCMLGAYVKNGDVKRAIELLTEMCESPAARRAAAARVGSGAAAFTAAESSPSPPQQSFVSSVAAAALRGVGTTISGGIGGANKAGTAATTQELPPRRRLDVAPDMVSFSTVILGLARSSNVFAGRKAMALYREMRERFGLTPDEVMADGMLRACCNSRARRGGLSLEDGRKVLKDLQALNWPAEVISRKREMLLRIVPLLSEVWRESEQSGAENSNSGGLRRMRRSGGANSNGEFGVGPKAAAAAAATTKPSISDMLFAKYNWNKISSDFPIL